MRLAFSAMAAVVGVLTSVVSADTQFWNGYAEPDTFGNPASWSGGVVPDADDTASFRGLPFEGEQVVIHFDDHFTNDSLEIDDSTLSFDLGGHTYTLANLNNSVVDDTVSINIGPFGGTNPSLLKVTNGTLAGVAARVGSRAGGALIVGLGANVSLSHELTVGFLNSGMMTIEDGGDVVSVDGVIGSQNISSGVINVVGSGSTWTISDGGPIVGLAGTGTLNILDGGTVNATGDGGTSIGASGSASNEVKVSGSGSTLNAQSLAIGGSGTGMLTIEHGGQVDNTSNARLGSGSTGNGSALVIGTDSMWTTAGLFVGRQSQGSVNVEAGGAVASSLRVDIGSTSTGTGHVTVTGASSRLTTTSFVADSRRIYIGGNSEGAQGTGTLTVADGGIVDLGGAALTVWQTGTLDGNGGTIIGDVINHGAVSPGASPGLMTIGGNYIQSTDGVLILEMGGLTSGSEHDQLIVSGDATIVGTVVLRFIDFFAPSQGQTFDLMSVTGSLTDTFLAVQVENLEEGFEFDLQFSNGGYTLTALNDGRFVPEPTSLALLGLAAPRLCFRGRGRGRRHLLQGGGAC